MSDLPVPIPRVWHLPQIDRPTGVPHRPVVVGRQAIFDRDRAVYGYELLFRAPGRLNLRIDLWNSWQQDRATEHVLAAAFFHGDDISDSRPSFVNFTRTYLLDPGRYLQPPDQIVIEVVESAHADWTLYERLADLKAEGYRIAIDDFVGTTSQRDLLELADFVKVDLRDVNARGPGLIDAARVPHASLIAERVETEDALLECLDAGFDLFQGHHFEPAKVIERDPLPAP
ncbi:MAG: EAL domain-containing protein [Demequinaceae bacterium]|nr:EAL domain-containing protein [Demequinaceae bacterium]